MKVSPFCSPDREQWYRVNNNSENSKQIEIQCQYLVILFSFKERQVLFITRLKPGPPLMHTQHCLLWLAVSHGIGLSRLLY